MRGLVLSTCVLVACVQPSLVECPDGRICPSGTVCDVRHRDCVDREQATACAGLADLNACATSAIADGRCFGEICLPRGCGNAELEPEELCDDGNTLAGDGCGASCLSLERCGDGFVESPREECDDGNVLGQDGCSSRCFVETLVFERIQVSPPLLDDVTSAYDPIRERLVVFTTGPTGLPATLEWDGQHWFDLTPTSSPAPRTDHVMAYDPKRKVVVMFGGFGELAPLNETWEWNGARWLRRTPATAPLARASASLAWDPRIEKVVLFGGVAVLLSFADTWTWDGEIWERIATPTSPTPRGGAAMVFDATRDRLIVAGGFRSSLTSVTVQDTWAFDGTTWTQISTATLPAPTGNERATYDAKRDVVVLSSGTTYELVADRWISRSTSPAAEGAIHYMPATERVIELAADVAGNPFDWDGATWTQRPLAPWPAQRRGAVAVSDPFTGRVLLFGGLAATSNQTWEWDGRHWIEHTATSPGALTAANMVYDASRREVILFGGAVGTVRQNSTWRWDGSSWSLASSAGPSPRTNPAMTYDASRGTVLLFGGITDTGPSAETWEWNGTSWSQLAPPQAPSARSGSGLAYDRQRQRAVLFGGRDPNLPLDDTWEWNGATWSELTSSTTPLVRSNAGMVFDEARKRTLLFGGTISEFAIWEWDGVAWSQPLTEWQVGILNGPAAAYDPVHRKTLVFGGNVSTTIVDAMYLAHFTSGDVELCDDRDLDHDGLVGCTDGDCAGRCTPGCWTSPCDPGLPRCDDGACGAIETWRSCPSDCPLAPTCGDLTCDPAETCGLDC